jgi:predicted metal-dependent peptidase
MSAQSKITAARTSLVLEQPFFGSLALSLKMQANPGCGTAWVDGRTLGYEPAFIESLTHAQITALLAHEVMHCALGHPWRRDGRNPKRFNVACDRAINYDLKESGFTLPPDHEIATGEEIGKSAEWIYARLPEPGDEDGQGGGGGTDSGQGDGQGQGKPDPLGEVRDAPTSPDSDGDPAPTEGEWKQRAASAMQQAKMQGSMPGGLAREVERALRPRVDVRSLLLRFFSERSTGDYSWTRPNPRYLSQGLYLPALESKALGEVAIMIDTSGSVDAVSLSYARSIVESVIEECNPSAVTVFYVDAQVCRIDRFAQGEPLVWHPCGGGGTNFTSFFECIERGEESPVCVMGISDLDATFPPMVPSVPVLWLSTEEDGTAPFGEVVYLER